MKLLFFSGKNDGSALLVALTVITVLAAAAAITFSVTSTSLITTDRSRDMDRLEAAGEGVLEYAYGMWSETMRSTAGFLTTAEAQALLNTLPPLPPGMSYASTPVLTAVDKYGAPAEKPELVPGLSESPKGWQTSGYHYMAEVTLAEEGPGGQPREVTMRRVFQYDLVSPLGGMFFMEGNFELYKPAPMIISGDIHTNGRGYVSTHYSNLADKLRFTASSNISFVKGYEHVIPPGASSWSAPGNSGVQLPIYERGFEEQVRQSTEVEGIGTGTMTEFDTADDNPNNDGNRELIEPPVAGHEDPPAIEASRIYNNAGLVVDITGQLDAAPVLTSSGNGSYTGNGITIQAKNGTTLNATQANSIAQALSNTTTETTTESYKVYYYDW